MKNDEIEKEIVDRFVIKPKRKRILWELNSSKKRKDAIWRFTTPHILRPECLKPIGFFDPKGLKKYLLKIKNKRIVYYLGHSFAGYVDIDQATEMSSNDLCCIIYCGDGIGYYQGEQYEGRGTGAAPPRFLLCAN